MKTVKNYRLPNRRVFILSILLIGIVGFALNSQSIRFTYDQAGNRILRVPDSNNAIKKANNAKPYAGADLEIQQVTLGPNPTTGIINIRLSGYDDAKKYTVNVYSNSGQLVVSSSISSAESTVNIGTMPKGIYIVSVGIDESVFIEKIVKL